MRERSTALLSRHCSTSIMISPQSESDVSISVSCVKLTPPSIEFSIGTTPCSASPRTTASNTAGIDGAATGSTPLPKCASAASYEKVPSGPRKATRRLACCELPGCELFGEVCKILQLQCEAEVA